MAIPQGQERQPVDEHGLPVDEHGLTAALAGMVRDDPAVLRMWVSSHRGVASFWLLTQASVATAAERRLYGLSGALFDRFPEADFRLHVVNPRDYEPFELDIVLPTGAKEIALRAA